MAQGHRWMPRHQRSRRKVPGPGRLSTRSLATAHVPHLVAQAVHLADQALVLLFKLRGNTHTQTDGLAGSSPERPCPDAAAGSLRQALRRPGVRAKTPRRGEQTAPRPLPVARRLPHSPEPERPPPL